VVAIELRNYNGLTKEVNLSENKMINYLENHKEEFKKLTIEYIKKLESINDLNSKI